MRAVGHEFLKAYFKKAEDNSDDLCGFYAEKAGYARISAGNTPQTILETSRADIKVQLGRDEQKSVKLVIHSSDFMVNSFLSDCFENCGCLCRKLPTAAW